MLYFNNPEAVMTILAERREAGGEHRHGSTPQRERSLARRSETSPTVAPLTIVHARA